MAEDLERFTKAHESNFARALQEIRSGRKQSHWMWYIFPQLKGLGRSDTARFYGIKDMKEAQAFLQHPILGRHLVLISTTLLHLPTDNPTAVFGKPDDIKLHSSMTLFSQVPGASDIFEKLIGKYFDGKQDDTTLQLLQKEGAK